MLTTSLQEIQLGGEHAHRCAFLQIQRVEDITEPISGLLKKMRRKKRAKCHFSRLKEAEEIPSTCNVETLDPDLNKPIVERWEIR